MSSSQYEGNDESDLGSDDGEEIEPKLKYVRMMNDLQNILMKDAVSCIAVHTKLICVGTHFGHTYVLDHQGNIVKVCGLKSHAVTVNQISIDKNGEYIATCSDDGNIFVYGLYASDCNYTLNTGKSIKHIAIDPNFARTFQFVSGDERLTLYERSFLNRLKNTILCEAEGYVCDISWNENGKFVAWASLIGVRVYDLLSRCSLGLIKWESSGVKLDDFKCNLRWSDQRMLLIGWVDTVQICTIRKRTNLERANREQPDYIVDSISMFTTDFYICGIAPLDHQLVILGLNKDRDADGKSQRPQLYIVEYGNDDDYVEICTDCLSLRGYSEYTCVDYNLDVLIEENRFFIVSPKDIIVASAYDIDDRINWLIEHSKFEDAITILTQSKQAKKFNLLNVGKLYLNHLLAVRQFDKAGRLCLKIFQNSKQLWQEQIYKFAKMQQLRAISPYIPRALDCKLEPHIYEMVLYEFLKLDQIGFLKLVKEWNPVLYNTSAVINAVKEQLLISANETNAALEEALAMLYLYEKNYEESLNRYLKLRHKGVFDLIENFDVRENIDSRLVDLMTLDCERTISLIIHQNSVDPDKIVAKLKEHEVFLYKYLDMYCKSNPKSKYNSMLVRLYAFHAPEKLLPFLKSNDCYSIQQALNICKEREMYSEMVYLLSRMGNSKEALQLIVTKLNDMYQAIMFCQQHNDAELWNDLIEYSLDKPQYVNFLLQRIATYVDPRYLVSRIEKNFKIDGLKHSLVKMLRDYNLQVSVQDGCKKILMSDYFNLHEKLVKLQKRGMHLVDESVCAACHRRVICNDADQMKPVVMYMCKHLFHGECLPSISDTCPVCYKSKGG